MCKKVIASEYVSYGHPDKIADQISDAILDAFLEKDPNTRAGIETMVKDNIVVLGGEINSKAKIDYDSVVRRVYSQLPFPKNHHLSADNIKIINLIGKQSPEIHQGVDKSEDVIGAGDQGFCVGYASNETDVYMPLGHYIAKKICFYVANRTDLEYGPDTKSQVIVEYDDEKWEPRVVSILVSTMHQDNIENVRRNVKDMIMTNLVDMDKDVFNKYINGQDIKIDVNPCGEWKIGGPVSDCGVTGRKIVVDQYGGYCNVGGGAYSGKEGTKVDRSASYMARYLAKNIVATGICDNCKVELSYMIGVPEPSSINIEMNANCKYAEAIKQWIIENVDLTPYGIMKRFETTLPRYYYTAKDGHYGFNVDNSATIWHWEKLDLVEDMKKIF